MTAVAENTAEEWSQHTQPDIHDPYPLRHAQEGKGRSRDFVGWWIDFQIGLRGPRVDQKWFGWFQDWFESVRAMFKDVRGERLSTERTVQHTLRANPIWLITGGVTE